MSPRRSAERDPSARIFLIGAPRSGTTWLQRMMGSHPLVVTSQETLLLSGYVRAWLQIWERQLRPPSPERWSEQRHKGLPAVLTESEFHRLLRDVVDEVHRRIAALKPSASVVLEKDPSYALHVARIHALLPEATFVHLIRDGRDVAASLAVAGRSWGARWAPPDVAGGAAVWTRYVTAGRSTGLPTPRYVEVRYEALLARPAEELHRVLTACGVEADLARCREIADAHSLPATRGALAAGRDPGGISWGGEVIARLGAPPAEPAGFLTPAAAALPWRRWSASTRVLFERVAGALMAELGYGAESEWKGGGRVRRTVGTIGAFADRAKRLASRKRRWGRPRRRRR